MAQLRHAETSALLAEGDPRDLVAIADEIGPALVVFDDVGGGFDPDAVRQATAEQLDAAPTSALQQHLEQLAGPVAQAVDAALAVAGDPTPVEVPTYEPGD